MCIIYCVFVSLVVLNIYYIPFDALLDFSYIYIRCCIRILYPQPGILIYRHKIQYVTPIISKCTICIVRNHGF